MVSHVIGRRAVAADEAVRAATASVRGAALAVAVNAGAALEQIRATLLDDGTGAVQSYAALVRQRSSLQDADDCLRVLEHRSMHYVRRAPRGAPTTGDDLAQVQVARQLLDDARDALLDRLHAVRDQIALSTDPADVTPD
jgi:hypothetical protein